MLKHLPIRIISLVIAILMLFMTSNIYAETNAIATDQVEVIEPNMDLGFRLYSPYILLMDSTSGKILYEHNSEEIIYPASTTKVMTAILTLENCKLDDVATVSHNAIFSIPPTYAIANLKEGEKLTIEQLLHVLLIPSANDAAVVLAEHIAGSVDNFSEMMNQKAKEIGCKNTNFKNPNGIHHADHYTTAYDMALIGQYAMQNPTFRSIVSKTKYTLPITNMYDKEDRIFRTTNELIRENHSNSLNNYYYKDCIGGKTGYTNAAQSCIVTSAKKGDQEFLVCVMGGQKTEAFLNGRDLDCIALFDYAFKTFQSTTLVKEQDIVTNISVPNATKETKSLDLYAKSTLVATLDKNLKEESNLHIEIREDLEAPLSENEVVGKATYTIDGISYETDLLASHTVYRIDYFKILLYILLAIFVLMIVTFLGGSYHNRKKNMKKKQTKKKSNSSKRKKTNQKNFSEDKPIGGNYRYMQLHTHEE